MTQVILVELNEVNFDFVRQYAQDGKLPTFKALIADHGLDHTSSEKEYHEWEPWIQWVTAHTGQTLAEHNIFRLGDVVHTEVEQIWEVLERDGLRVGALSPMNARNRLSDPAFFLPDPWTQTNAHAPAGVLKVYKALADAVSENASGRLSPAGAASIMVGLARYSRPENYLRYLGTASRSLSQRWLRAVFLDIFLGDIFIRMLKKTRPQFSSIFLNAAAHLQHHYMFSSAAYAGKVRNPAWYIPTDADPILDVYKAYDDFLGQLRANFPEARLMLATGLHQKPHEEETYYWRLLNHRQFLEQAGLTFREVQARMSRDFVVFCDTAEDAARCEAQLATARAADGEALFTVDNRGDSLFVELTYSRDVPAELTWSIGNRECGPLKPDVAFVAIKNGRHDGMGYFLDTAATAGGKTFPLTELPSRIREACSPLARAAA